MGGGTVDKKKEEATNRRALHYTDDSRPLVEDVTEYSTPLLGLQEVIEGKFTPKRERAETVAGLYHTLARRVENMGPECLVSYLQMEGQKGFDRVWSWMHFMSGEEILYHVRAWLLRWYSGHGYKVDDCGTLLQYHVMPEAASLVHANFCRDRMCPLCNWRRSLKVFGQVSKIMTELDKRGYRYLFLTLTIRNVWGRELSDGVQALYDGWRVLYHDYMRVAASARTVEKRLKGVVMGTFRALEVTVSDGEYSPTWAGSFHPHLHVILAVQESYFERGHYLKTAEWSDIWRKACRLDYNPSIKIEAVKPLVGPLDVPTEAGTPLDYAGAVAELSKYPLKDADFLCDADYQQPEGQYMDWLLKALRRRRLVGLTGCFREVAQALALDDMETGDLVAVDGAEGEQPEIRDDVGYLIVNYNWRCGAYHSSIIKVGSSEFRDDTYRLTLEDVTPEAAAACKKRKKRKVDC